MWSIEKELNSCNKATMHGSIWYETEGLFVHFTVKSLIR